MRKEFAARSSGDAGFTLIEMLVSLALLALISATLIQMINGARRALNFADRTNSAVPIMNAQNYLHNALIHALGVAGDSDHIAFTTSYAPLGAYQGLYRVSIGPSPNGHGGFDLVAEQELVRQETNTPAATPHLRSRLIENIAGVSFSYFTKHDEGEDSWQSDWISGMPTMISVDVRFPRNDVRRWQPMIVSIAAADTNGIRCPNRVNCG
ncbi:prepilin-type N-terminal cleavage/methylation domain-containing protein [Hyphomicrobium sp. 99]|uniref:prepilin-type N-terminal cleavage/methylation domain-containing protein n=1 Tax=Hyphomicrobium sp. 99 TaxID=1163419 RepID=UPI0005F78EEA|nr:prepilin-type N-terminal cleavage/methylation domain-containing protein [Hyphomicrobium sp. 99]